MFSKSVRISVLLALLVVALFVAVIPAHAAPLAGDPKPACTVTSKWWEKLFGMCVDLDKQVPVSAPAVVTIDTAKWEQALNNAETALRAASNGNNDPVDNSNIVKDNAWKLYCDAAAGAQPKYDMQGHPVCQ